MSKTCFLLKVDSSKESAEAACDILSQLVNCSLKTLGLISTARPSFMDLPKVCTAFVLVPSAGESSESPELLVLTVRGWQSSMCSGDVLTVYSVKNSICNTPLKSF